MKRKIIVIAEVGVNHNGNLETAKELITVAKDIGADFVKFQTFEAKNIVTNTVKTLDYQKNNIKNEKIGQFELLKSLELSKGEFLLLKNFAENIGIDFLTTGFGLEVISFLEKLNLKYAKIPSGEMMNVPYLRKMTKLDKPILLSTGMANLEDIAFSLEVLTKNGFPADKITLLHCVTMYPTPINLANIGAIETLKSTFGLNVGLSDHTSSTDVPILAIGYGCNVIEKHLTLDNNQTGPDHKASLNPIRMEKMIKKIRTMESAIGSGIKEPTSEELKTINLIRPKIICRRSIKRGEKIRENDLTTMRSDIGIDSKDWDSVIGSLAKRNFFEGEPLE